MLLSEKIDDPDIIIKQASTKSPHKKPENLLEVGVLEDNSAEEKKEELDP